MNAFDTFSITPTLELDEQYLREIYQSLAAKNHPDNGGNKVLFDQINRDYASLKSPSKRLKVFMDYKNIEYDTRGVVSNELMDLFMLVGTMIQNADQFLRKKSAASSTLAKALLESESIDTQTKIAHIITKIEDNQIRIDDVITNDIADSELPQIARNLAFLEKWHAQLQQRYGSLF